jgi:type IV secretion system protein TrbL
MGAMRPTVSALLLLSLVLAVPVAQAQAVDMHSVVDTLLARYKSAGQTWTITIENAATHLFWILAMISFSWTCVSMAIRQSDLIEIVGELSRFIMFTGFFFWLLLHGASFGNAIVNRSGRSAETRVVQVNQSIPEI